MRNMIMTAVETRAARHIDGFKRMKLIRATAAIAAALAVVSCGDSREEWISEAIDTASFQLKMTAEKLEGTGELPRSTYTGYTLEFLESQIEGDISGIVDSLTANPPSERVGTLLTGNIYDWTSGFFPGSLWYAYELTGDEELKQEAISYTNLLSPLRKFKDTHDLGFMVGCSFGNALRLSPSDTVKDVIMETADNLAARFNPMTEAIHIADMIMERNTAPDLVPYWDFDAPVRPETPRDASAGALIASAFLELSTFVPDGETSSRLRDRLPYQLCGYYYLEALKRLKDLTR